MGESIGTCQVCLARGSEPPGLAFVRCDRCNRAVCTANWCNWVQGGKHGWYELCSDCDKEWKARLPSPRTWLQARCVLDEYMIPVLPHPFLP